MEVVKIKGIVINEKPYGETSKILFIITKEFGVISVLSKGCKRLKNKLRNCSSIFCYANFDIVYKENKLSILVDGEILNNFNNIKKDIEKLSYLNFITDLTNGVVKQNDDKRIFDIFLSAILKINDGFDSLVITNILEVKYLSFLGVSPKLDGCVICGNKNVVSLSSYKGGFVCINHLDNDYIVSSKTIKLIRMLLYVDISKITKLDVSNEVKNEINNFLNDYYDRYTGLYLKSKKFLKKINNLQNS